MGNGFPSHIVKFYIIYSQINKLVCSTTYDLYLSMNQYNCPGGASDTCIFHCDGVYGSNIFCGNVGACQVKIIDICDSITINATAAQYLEIIVGSRGFLHRGSIYCPVNSDYNGPEVAPCILDATGGGLIFGPEVHTKYGIPRDAWMKEGSGDILIDMLYCDAGSTPDYTSKTSVCWQTHSPTVDPTSIPTKHPSRSPTISPSKYPSKYPTSNPTASPTVDPTSDPTIHPTTNPSLDPTANPTIYPTANPTIHPTTNPTIRPTMNPSPEPTVIPTTYPTTNPTTHPTVNPSVEPTISPSRYPSKYPTSNPTKSPTVNPTSDPTIHPTTYPTTNPTIYPTMNPSPDPTVNPTTYPTTNPTVHPSPDPTTNPTTYPTVNPSVEPTTNPSIHPTVTPTVGPTSSPTASPSDASDDTLLSESVSIGGQSIPIFVAICIMICVCVQCVVICLCLRLKKKKMNIPKDDELSWIRIWLVHVMLPQYYDNLVSNGYQTIREILSIKTKSQLFDIGILKKGHQTLLLSEIHKLRKAAAYHQQQQHQGGDQVLIQMQSIKTNMSLKYLPSLPLSLSNHISIIVPGEKQGEETISDEMIQNVRVFIQSLQTEALAIDHSIQNPKDDLIWGNKPQNSIPSDSSDSAQEGEMDDILRSGDVKIEHDSENAISSDSLDEIYVKDEQEDEEGVVANLDEQPDNEFADYDPNGALCAITTKENKGPESIKKRDSQLKYWEYETSGNADDDSP
eukprot:1037826_1